MRNVAEKEKGIEMTKSHEIGNGRNRKSLVEK